MDTAASDYTGRRVPIKKDTKMSTRHSVEHACNIMEQYVQQAGNDAAGIVGGEVYPSHITFDFNHPVNIDTGHVAEQTGYNVSQSHDGHSITIRPR